jgi:N-acetylglucosaminyldiphosphoundecaprenol N-acetyl-beta-D-mannosaminyltransferase
MSKTLQLFPSAAARHRPESVVLRMKPWQSASTLAPDDLSRNVYGLLGLSLDAISFPSLLQSMENAVEDASPFLISTPNVNFLITSQNNNEFRDSILQSDLCLADGMPLIWIAKFLQVPINERVAGSDLFGKLKSRAGKSRPLKIFLLGGAEGLAETVCKKLKAEKCGLQCVGVLNPGFGTIEEMSSRSIIDTINAAQADLLAVFFGAQKAQAWLMLNHRRLKVPVRAQFGATINFEAGTVKRAPHFIRSTGFEWLWRIKEEPYLWRRYWGDGKALMKLMLTSVLPLVIDNRLRRRPPGGLSINVLEEHDFCAVQLQGDAVAQNVDQAISHFRCALESSKQIIIDIANVRNIDPRMFGLFLMIKKTLANRGQHLSFVGVSPQLRRIFRLNRFEFLLLKKCETNSASRLLPTAQS